MRITFCEEIIEPIPRTAIVLSTTNATALLKTLTDLKTQADALLFMEGRLNYHNAKGVRADKNAGAPSVFCAYGVDDADILSQCGIPCCFVPLKFRSLVFGFAAVGTWIDEVLKVVERKCAAGSLDELYRSMADNPKAQRYQHWKAKIRQTLQKGPFEPVRKGVWKLSQGKLF